MSRLMSRPLLITMALVLFSGAAAITGIHLVGAEEPDDQPTALAEVAPSEAAADAEVAGAADAQAAADIAAGPALAAAPCGTAATAPAKWDHVVWIWMENHSINSVVGSADMPYLNSTLIKGCGLASGFKNETHLSLPNYLASVSGIDLAALKTFTGDCSPSTSCSSKAKTIFQQTPSWKAYQEDMPSNCAKANSGKYVARHNPATYFPAVTDCATKDVPYTQLAKDLTANALPAFSFITPNNCNNTHDCNNKTGDEWLRLNLPTILNSATYAEGKTAVFVTWDEGECAITCGFSRGKDCITSNASDCKIATIVISPSTKPGTVSTAAFNHYSMLRTTEEMLGITELLGKAATSLSMRSAFNL